MVVGDEDYFRYKFIWHYLITDEGHRIKNEKTLQAQALSSIPRYNAILLSGTPTQNNTHEIWALLHFLLPKVFTTSEPFDRCFNLTTNSIDQEQLMKIHTLLKPLMLRRVKSEMLQKLPKKTETKIFVGLTQLQKEWYRKLVSKDMNLLLSQSASGSTAPSTASDVAMVASSTAAQAHNNNNTADQQQQAVSSSYAHSNDWRKLLNLMMNLRKICNHPYLISGEAEPRWDLIRSDELAEDNQRKRAGKKPLARESIETRAGKALIQASGKMMVLDKLLTKLKSEGGHRVLLFSLFTRVLDLLEDFFAFKGWSYLRLDGSTNRVRRSVDIRRFNDPNSRFFVYLISTRAGGLGINLTGADTVVHFDSDFNPQCDLQAQDRCHRIGQTKPVMVYRFITENTVEERLIARAEKKLFLDMMVNRQSHTGDFSENNMSTSEQEELTKLSKDEMLSMLMFGASRIFKATEEQRDEDIEAILQRSKAKDGEAKQAKLKSLMAKRAALLTSTTTPAEAMELIDDDGHAVIQTEQAELQALKPHMDSEDMEDVAAEEKESEKEPDAKANLSSSLSSNIIENAQLNLKDFVFDGKGERKVHEFEGLDFSQQRKLSRREANALAASELIVEAGKKRERKQRLVTVEDGRGRNFSILASQAADETLPVLRDQRTKGRKRARSMSTTRVKKEEEELERAKEASRATPTSASGSTPTEPLVEAEPVIEPQIIGHDYAINWTKSSAKNSRQLEAAVKALNQLDESGVDVTENEHKLSLWLTRTPRWNMTKDERIAYERRIHEEQKQMIALRDAKRRRWEEGAPEEDWLHETKLEKAQAQKEKEKTNGTGKKKRKGENGEYLYNDKYVHEDWW